MFFIENTSSVLEGWWQNLNIFYKSEGTEKVVEEIKSSQVVLIVGNSGTGKTTAMHYASRQVMEDGFEIVPVSSPSEIPSQRFPHKKQLFVIDNVVCRHRVDKIEIDSWDRYRDRILVVFKEKTAKLMMTSRREVYEDLNQILSTIFDLKIVDLDSNNLALSEDERKGMFRLYLETINNSTQLSDRDITEICSNKMGFPLLCKMFTSNENFLSQKANFFKSPFEFFERQLNSLQKDDKVMYCVLVLLLIFDVKELKCIFDMHGKIERRDDYALVLSACEVSEGISRHSLRKDLISMAGSFVELRNPFKFIHDTLEETLACHFGCKFQDIFLKCCKSGFIRDKVRLNKPSTEDKPGNSIIVKSEHYDALLGRIFTEISSGKFHDVLLCKPMRDEHFIIHFISYAQQKYGSLKNLEKIECTEKSSINVVSSFMDATLVIRYGLIDALQRKEKSFICWVAAIGSFPLFKVLLERPKNRVVQAFKNSNFITKLLHLAAFGGNIENINLLIKKGGNVLSYDDFGIPLLCKVAGTNRYDIAELLIRSGADVNQCDQVMGWTACFFASWFDELEMLKLLIRKGASVNQKDSRGMTLLVLAASKGNRQIVHFLLEKDPKSIDTFINSSFFRKHCHYVINEVLDRKHSKMIERHLGKSKQTAAVLILILITQKRSSLYTTMNRFLQYFKKRNYLSNDDITLLKAVVFEKTQNLLDILQKKESAFTTMKKRHCNRLHNDVLLHVAVMCDTVATAKPLIQYGANPLYRDFLGRTSFHLARSSAMLNTLLNAKCEQDFIAKLSLRNQVFRGLKFCFFFEFIPFLLNYLEYQRTNLNVNIRDDHGNTPLHSIVKNGSGNSDMDQCLDAAETLINNGAAVDIRDADGLLPIDYFRSSSLKRKDDTIDRGEVLFGGEKIRTHIKREQICFTILIFVFIRLYIYVYTTLAKTLYIQENFTKDLKEVPPIKVKSYVSYAQIIFIFIMPLVFQRVHRLQLAQTLGGFEITANLSKSYLERLFFYFSLKVTGFSVMVRWFCNLTDHSIYTDILFNVFCTILCFVYFLIAVSCLSTYKTYCRLLHSSFICFAKFLLVFYLVVWLLYLIRYGTIDQRIMNIHVFSHYNEWMFAFLVFAFKLTLFGVYKHLFLFQLLRPLLYIMYQPLFWRTREVRDIYRMCGNLFIIADIMTVPFTLVCYSV